jgi:hypothetical protein
MKRHLTRKEGEIKEAHMKASSSESETMLLTTELLPEMFKQEVTFPLNVSDSALPRGRG